MKTAVDVGAICFVHAVTLKPGVAPGTWLALSEYQNGHLFSCHPLVLNSSLCVTPTFPSPHLPRLTPTSLCSFLAAQCPHRAQSVLGTRRWPTGVPGPRAVGMLGTGRLVLSI